MMIRPMILTLALLSACVAPPPAAPTPQSQPLPGTVVKYTCAGGGHLAVIYDKAKVTLEGPETLLAEDATNTRYSWPSDGTHHVWTLSGNIGTLLLHDGTNGTETVFKSGCKPDGV